MEIAKNKFIKNLKRLRVERGMTQYELGLKCGLGTPKAAGSKISSYEHGRYSPTFKTLDLICKALDIQTHELFE